MNEIPRSEYPRPQFVRREWINLNGDLWTYEFDFGKSGLERGLRKSTGFTSKINVPFCPESELSGVAHTDFIERMFYHRKLDIPSEWEGKRILLHFGAVDYECAGYVDGEKIGSHIGGSTSFTFDLTGKVTPGKSHDFVLWVSDELRSQVQMGGKQSHGYRSAGCSYTRTTGIWQTVWLEPVDMYAMKRCTITPDLDNASFHFTPEFFGEKKSLRYEVRVLAAGKEVGKGSFAALSGLAQTIPVSETHTWSPEDPFLYDLEITVLDGGAVIDRIESYAGLRKVHIEGNKCFLNNKEFFFRLVLDQGFYRKGIWTAPSDADLKQDIELSMAAGFNGARLHQKVFEERFHYWADKLGYVTWGESGSWGASCFNHSSNFIPTSAFWQSSFQYLHEWREILLRDLNHPSILAWSPANEAWPGDDFELYSKLMTEIYDFTKTIDPTRPCNEVSGYHHVKTDLWTVHCYCGKPDELHDTLVGKGTDLPVWIRFPQEIPAWKGQPYINDEFGGFLFVPPDKTGRFASNTWGYYGMEIKTPEEYVQTLEKQVDVMLHLPDFSGFCFTQLTDVEQEQNGVLTYDRVPKAPLEQLKAVFGKKR